MRHLTERQQQILDLVGDGLSNAEIGARLVITEQTVKNHLHDAYRRLGARNRMQAVRIAAAHGH
jgi:DNA-binding NarL/FixJ family response regulator